MLGLILVLCLFNYDLYLGVLYSALEYYSEWRVWNDERGLGRFQNITPGFPRQAVA
jgi:hypothetical protein